jgi:hypothetical protein
MICLVTEYVAANCSVCGKPAEPVHIVGDRLYCLYHCPIRHHPVNVQSTVENTA